MARAWIILMRTFTGLVLLLKATGPTSDEKKEMAVSIKVLCPKELIIEEGEDAIVPCYLDPRTSAKHMEIKFSLSAQNSKLVHLFKEGADNSSTQDPQFKGRTFLRTDRIHEGCFDLLIRRVGPKDSGNYKVFIKSKYYFSPFSFNVTVTAAVPEPYIHITPFQDGQVNLTCNIPEWHQVTKRWWEGNAGKKLTPAIMEEEQINIDQAGNYTCHVRNFPHGKNRTATVSIEEPLLQKHFCLRERVYAGIVTFVIVIVAISYYYFRHDCWRKRKPREAPKSNQEGTGLLMDQPIDPESQNLQNQMASERCCQQHAMTPFSEVDIVLDNRNPFSKLWVSEDRKSVKLQNNGPDASNPCNEAFANFFVLGREGFKQGKYRWEVEVGCAKLWAVGIALESVSQMGLSRLAPDEGVWAVGLTVGQYQAFTTPVTALSQKDQLEKLEVYLDVDGGQLSFYDSGTKQHIYSHMCHYTDKVLPFFWTMDPNNPVTVCSPAAADNGKVSA